MGNDETGTPGLRERKKAATRTALRAAAVRLVLEHGLAAVTVEDVAAAANVSPRTFFNYFTSKEEALLGPSVHVCEPVGQALRERPHEESPLEVVRALLPRLVDAVGGDRSVWRDRAEVVRANPQLLPHLLQTFVAEERGLATAIADRTGLSPDDEYPALMAAHVMALLRVTISRWSQPGATESLLDALDRAVTSLAAGLPAPEAPGQ